jgi:hypothetical protein
VLFFLRLTGITTAALWFGAAVFFSTAIWPAFSSEAMAKILPPSHSGAAAEILLARYFSLQYWLGGVALCHLVLEWLYAGKSLQRYSLYLVVGLLGLSLFNGHVVEPRLRKLHLEIYGRRSTPQQREQASGSFRVWSSVVHVSQLIAVVGLWAYLWDVSSAGKQSQIRGRWESPGLTNRGS